MKSTAFSLLISLILALFFGTGDKGDVPVEASPAATVSEQRPADDRSDFCHNRELCLTSSQGSVASGESSTLSVSVHSSGSGRRVQPSAKSSYRMVKGGKLIDRNVSRTFLVSCRECPSGQLSHDRYLHSICRLLV